MPPESLQPIEGLSPDLVLELPLGFERTSAFALGPAGPASAADLHAAAAALRIDVDVVVNLCENRYLFLAVFAATLARSAPTLLPPSRAVAVIQDIVDAYPGAAIIDDSAARALQLHGQPSRQAFSVESTDFIAVIGHTSGSTGQPTAHRKRWNSLRATTALNARAIRAEFSDSVASRVPWIVATVPSQHMYGVELSVLLPLLAGFGIHVGQPLYPADIAAALHSVPAPRVLVSTPAHLRALMASGVELPPVEVVVSATAPLSRDLALDVEERCQARLLEMFGATETCIFATRRTALKDDWRPYPGVSLRSEASGTWVSAPWLAQPTRLQDVLSIADDGSFTVIGRSADLVEVAGKRASIADITNRIRSIPGVQDACVVQLDQPDALGIRRIAAVVVADGLRPEQILERLRTLVDPLFLPRPLVKTETLPRTTVGKITRQRIMELLHQAIDNAGETSARDG